MVSKLIGSAYVIAGIGNIFRSIIERLLLTDRKTSLKEALLNLLIGAIIWITPNMQITMFGVLCGIYALLIGLIRGVNYILFPNNKVHGRLLNLVLCIFYLGYGGLLLFSPLLGMNSVLNILSVYFILYGITFLRDGLHEIIPNKHTNKIKRKIRISLPVIFEAWIPRFVLSEVNTFLEPSPEERHNSKPDFEEVKVDVKPDIEVFIHVTKDGYGSFGHVDLCIGDTVITYGNYDYSSYKLFDSIGDGVIIKAPRDEYVPFVIKDSQKTLFGFGLKLNEDQKKGVSDKLDSLMENVYEWIPPLFVDDPAIDTYSARVKHSVNARFYKFNSGKFKTYFVATTNCVQLADQIIGSTGIDLLGINGIITPGTYYEYLNKEFASNCDMVISKNIYK